MNTATTQLVLEITETVLRVNAQGRWHGFFQYSGHVEEVDVYFRPAGTNYQQATEQHAPVRSFSVYTSTDMHDSEAAMHRELRKLLTFARKHLAQPGKEAA